MKNIKRILFPLLLVFFFLPVVAQQTTIDRVEISGVIKDNSGEPLIGVSIVAKNQPGLGTTTNLDGEFTFRTGPNDVLIISYMGYKTQEVPVLSIVNKSNFVLVMEEDLQVVEDVVITATGRQRKQTVTGAFTTVDVKQLNAPGGNLVNALAGVVPGIIAMQTSGEPGENMSEFWIRGISTFGAKSGALILVDGVERSFNEIPVEDIESFSVLKDASATAIYGQRGANGVVLVTTKRGEAGKVKINAKFTYGYNTLTKSPDYADGYTYALMANEAKKSRYLSPLYTKEELSMIEHNLDRDLYPNINWRDLMLKSSAPTYSGNVNFSGGGDNARYFVSLGYYNEDGMFKTKTAENPYNTNTTLERFNYRTNVDINLTRTTIVKIGIGGWLTNQNKPHSESKDIWNAFAAINPLSYPRKYSTGEWAAYTPEVAVTQTGYRKIWENKMETNIGIDQELDFLLEGLTFRGVFAFDTYNLSTVRRYRSPELWTAENYRDANGNLILRRISEQMLMEQTSESKGNKRYYLQASLDYSRLFAEKHRFGAFAMVYQEETSNIDFGSDLFNSIPKRNLAYSGRFTYAFQDRYLAEFNWGYTGSENFEKGSRFGFFPAFSAGWVISEEPFVKNIAPWMDMFKVRASYGEVGNDVIDDTRFPYLTLISTSSGEYRFGEFGTNLIPGYRITKIGTPNLSWEKVKKYNLGIDYSFMNGRISGAVDIFKDVRSDIFMKRGHMPLTTGLQDQVPMANVGAMRNNGVDGNIEYFERIGKVNLTLRGNLTYQNNKVDDMDEAANQLWYQMSRGFRLNQTRGLIALGLFEDEEDIASSPRQTFGGVAVMPGDIKYKDVNGDGIIDDKDVVPLKYRTVPGIQYGFGFSADWNNFEISVLFQGSGKRDFFVDGSGIYPFQNESSGNILELMASGNRWIAKEISGDPSTENPNADWPRLTYGSNDNNNRNSTFWLKNGAYLRLRNVEVAYNIPREPLRKLQMSNLKVGFIGQNLYTWSPFKWWDPESGQSNGSNYPITKVFSLYARISF